MHYILFLIQRQMSFILTVLNTLILNDYLVNDNIINNTQCQAHSKSKKSKKWEPQFQCLWANDCEVTWYETCLHATLYIIYSIILLVRMKV